MFANEYLWTFLRIFVLLNLWNVYFSLSVSFSRWNYLSNLDQYLVWYTSYYPNELIEYSILNNSVIVDIDVPEGLVIVANNYVNYWLECLCRFEEIINDVRNTIIPTEFLTNESCWEKFSSIHRLINTRFLIFQSRHQWQQDEIIKDSRKTNEK